MLVNVPIATANKQDDVSGVLREVRCDLGVLRPYYDADGSAVISVHNSSLGISANGYSRLTLEEAHRLGFFHPVHNYTSLRRDDWRMLDEAVLKAARSRLRAWQDLVETNVFGGFDGMTKLVLEYEAVSDPGQAHIDFDALTGGEQDTPRFSLRGLPLPIIHSDFYLSKRRLAVSQNSNTPLDTTLAEAASRRVAETIEALTIGLLTNPVSYGTVREGPTQHDRDVRVYGYLNYPDRITSTDFSRPTATNWSPNKTVDDVLRALDALYRKKFYGPFMIYHSTDWDRFLDNDYVSGAPTSGLTSPNQTLRDRLRRIEGIRDVRRLDLLTADTHPFTILIVQMTPDVARAVVGMDITTIQWEEQGGMRLHFKVMAIMVPQIRSDYYGNCGIYHAVAA